MRARGRRLALAGCLAGAFWLAVGVRGLDPDEFGVLHAPLPGFPRQVTGWTVAPPGLARLARYPRLAVELPLPQAEELDAPSADGSRFGFRGRVTVRADPSRWRELDAAAGGRGLRGALEAGLRAAVEASGLRPAARSDVSAAVLRQFEVKAGENLAARGVSMVRLDLAALDFLSVPFAGAPPPLDTKLLVIGLDGADWAILDPLLRSGRAPNLAQLIARGVRADLQTIVPTLSPVVWTTVATGVEPARHGILDFMVRDPRTGEEQPVTSVQRRTPALWDMLSAAEVPVGVVGWWGTWPADPVRGYMVSDRLAFQLFGYRADLAEARGKTWPAGLYQALRPKIVAPAAVPWQDVVPYLGGERTQPQQFSANERQLLEEFRTVLASSRTYLEAALECRRRMPPRLEMVYLEGTDTAAHLFMRFRPPPLPGVPAEERASFGPVVDRVYEAADRWVGELVTGLDDSWTVMVLSDHGFATDDTRPRLTDSRIGHGPAADWHRKFGVLILSGRHVQAGARLAEASVYDIAPTVLALYGRPVPASWPGQVLAPALAPAFLAAHPVRFQAEDPERAGEGGTPGEDPGAADLRRKLQALGYVAPPGAPAGGQVNNAALAQIAAGRYAEAERSLRTALAASPDQPQLLVNLGLALRLQRKDAEARRAFEKARSYPATRRAASNLLSALLLQLGDEEGAERVAREALRDEPGASELHNSLGLALEHRRDLEGAESAYREAARLDPKAAEPRCNLGNLARARGELATAGRWYEEAISADPFFMGAYNNLALVRQDQGDVAGAMALYRQALEKAPHDAVVMNNLASLYYGTGDMKEAELLWRRAVQADSRYPSPLNNLAGIALTRGRTRDAEDLLQRALALEPDYGDARINLATVREREGKTDEARAELRRAAGDPRSAARAWTELGALEWRAGQAGAAAQALRRAVLSGARSADVFEALGDAEAGAGNPAAARRAWERSLALEPRRPRVREKLNEPQVRTNSSR
ncbi:MAG TPA: tetratricopeptide repeat protein [Candidatus Polarisedimenticolaceae bacterium]|nr:tetratricopeptide repeat protein [Candidatus Polarisedimenticolaceae bacterium]